jgi:FkbM family methyltransferase
LSRIDDRDQDETIAPSAGEGQRRVEEDRHDARPAAEDRIAFDHTNILVLQKTSADSIELLVLVPLSDGSSSEMRVTFGSPVRLIHHDGRYEYKIDINSNLTVTQSEKTPSGNVEVQSRDGLSWEIPAGYPGAWTGLLDHEPIVKEFLASRFRPGEVFVDVGANVGAYSLRAASQGMTVHSFEPNPENVKVLRRNCEINGLSIDLHECALGSSEGTASLAPNGAASRISDAGDLRVQVRTLDSFHLPRADLLKVDVEGYELEVLQGAVETLDRCHPAMMVEMHHWVGAEKEAALFEILSGLGYSFEYLDRYPLGRHLAATYSPRA